MSFAIKSRSNPSNHNVDPKNGTQESPVSSQVTRIDTTERAAAEALLKAERAERQTTDLRRRYNKLEVRLRRLEYETRRR